MSHGMLGVRHLAIPARELSRALKFYTEILPFQSYYAGNSDWAMLRWGGTTLSLLPLRSSPEGEGETMSGHPAHFGINVASHEDVEYWRRELVAKGAAGVSAISRHRDGSSGFYFDDSEGNRGEIVYIPFLPAAACRQDCVVVLVAHGEVDPEWRAPFEELRRRLSRESPKAFWTLAFSDRLEIGIERASRAPGVKTVLLLPLYLSTGGGMAGELSRRVEEARPRFSALELKLLPPIGLLPFFQQALAESVMSAVDPELCK